jgi:hypothetical protein
MLSMYSPMFSEPWLQVPLARLDLVTGAVDTLAFADFVPNPNLDPNDRWPIRNPFTAIGYSAAWTEGFVRGRGHETELTWLDLEGSVTQLLRWSAAPRPVTEDQLQAFEERMRENEARMSADNVPERFRPSRGWDAYIAATKAAATEPLPYFMDLIADPDGNVWIADYDFAGHARPGRPRPPRYRVVTAEGEWLGTVDMPTGVGVLALGRDHILGVEQNELDVQAVSLYRIER